MTDVPCAVQLYGNLLFLLKHQPDYLARLALCVSHTEIDTLLRFVMFSLLGDQYDPHEEQLLLRIFEVRRGRVAVRASRAGQPHRSFSHGDTTCSVPWSWTFTAPPTTIACCAPTLRCRA